MYQVYILVSVLALFFFLKDKIWIPLPGSYERYPGSWLSETDLGIGSLLGNKGASLAVFNDFEISWIYSWGNSHGSEKVTSGTLFQAASMSKPVAALTSIIAVKHGHFDLDDDVNELVKKWTLENQLSNGSNCKVTPRMLLSHTAGTSVWGFEGYDDPNDAPNLLEVLDGNGKSERVEVTHFDPGSRWMYSGGGCLVQQLALEETTGVKLEDLARMWIFEPFQMNSSQFEQPLSNPKRLNRAAHAHRGGKPFHVPFKVYPELAAAGLWTTAPDYARFLIGIQKLLSCDGSGLIRSMVSPVGVGRYGVGFQLYTRDVPPVFGSPVDTGPDIYFGHSGRNFGFTSMSLAHVSKGHGLAFFINDEATDFALFEELINRVAIKYGWSDAKVSMVSERIVINVEEYEGRNWFTDGDLISGKVILHVEKDIEVRSITATFLCREKATVRWSEYYYDPMLNRQNYRRRSSRRDYDYMRVDTTLFPTEEVARMNTNDGLKMVSGSHDFSFRFQIPNLSNYPPSWNTTDADVFWGVKVHVDKPSFFHIDQTVFHRISVFPTTFRPSDGTLKSIVDSGSLTAHLPGFRRGIGKLFDSGHRTKAWAKLSVGFPSAGLPQRPFSGMRITAETARPDLATIMYAKVWLSSSTYVSFDGHTNTHHCEHPIANIENVTFDSDGTVNVCDMIEKLGAWETIPIAPTFRTGWFNVNHSLEVKIKLKETVKLDSKLGHTEKLSVKTDCFLLSPSLIDSQPGPCRYEAQGINLTQSTENFVSQNNVQTQPGKVEKYPADRPPAYSP